MRIVRNQSQEGSRSASTLQKKDIGSEYVPGADTMLIQSWNAQQGFDLSNWVHGHPPAFTAACAQPMVRQNSGTHQQHSYQISIPSKSTYL